MGGAALRGRFTSPPVSPHSFTLFTLFSALSCRQEGKIAVLVGTITDDVRLLEVPKLRVAALRVTETARARILKARRGSGWWRGVAWLWRGGGSGWWRGVGVAVAGCCCRRGRLQVWSCWWEEWWRWLLRMLLLPPPRAGGAPGPGRCCIAACYVRPSLARRSIRPPVWRGSHGTQRPCHLAVAGSDCGMR